MLTADLAQSWRRGARIGPRYIDVKDPSYLRVADDLIKIVSSHIAHRRAELDRALEEYVGVGTEYKTIRGLIKLLLDECEFETVSPIDPVEIRSNIFVRAKEYHPVNADTRRQLLEMVAKELDCRPEDINSALYADLEDNQRLGHVEPLSAEELLNRYNLAQAQALLYRCIAMNIEVEPQDPSSSRQLFDSIKSYRLIHTISGSSVTGYTIKLDGPVSLFHRSQKYGVQMAVFLPALLLCKGWSMRAEISIKGSDRAYFELDSNQNRLHSHYLNITTTEHPIMDKIINGWSRLNSGWTLRPSKEVINVGEIAFIPDFIVEDENGKGVYLEVLGFWTPHHLTSRLKEFERCKFSNFIIVASEELCGSREVPSSLPLNVMLFKSSPDLQVIKNLIMQLIV
jgi:uncharacterized protein